VKEDFTCRRGLVKQGWEGLGGRKKSVGGGGRRDKALKRDIRLDLFSKIGEKEAR